MLGKKSSNPDDDFDFDFGGSDELFDLDDPFSGPNEKPPKGVKGYLKNVVKSIKNLGVKLGNEYLPESKSLLDDLKEDDEDNPSLKSLVGGLKAKAQEYTKESKNVAKDLGKDIKDRIKTGYFFKSEDDAFGDISFGDEDFGDSDLGDLSMDDDSTPAPDSSESGSVKSSSVPSMVAVTAKSARAQMAASIRMHNDTINATIGATQAHIKSETSLFNQNLIIESEHHRQKMLVMKNIASNVGKIIKQNNLSLKAQMEYSLKSLAFSNDIAAMLKEIRNVQWNAFVPKKQDDTNYDSKHNKIFGNGFKKTAWLKNFKDNFLMTTGLDGLFSMNDMISGMDGFGISKASMIKGMVGDMVFKNVADALMPKELRKNLTRIDTAMAGAPAAINNLLGTFAEAGVKEGGLMDTIFKKLPMGDKIKGLLESAAGMAHIDDFTREKTDRYTLKKEDRNKPHPFDNLAHKVLTEVIPRQLAKIEAGVNNHEEQFFDMDKNQFVGISTIKKVRQQNKDDVLEYSSGYSTASANMETAFGENETIKNLKLDNNVKQKAVKEVIRTLMRSGIQFTDINMKRIQDPEDFYVGNKVLNSFCQAANISMEELPDADKKNILKAVADGITKLKQSNPEEFIEFSQSATRYQNSLTRANLEIEEKYGSMGMSSGFDNVASFDQINKDIADKEKKRDALLKKMEDNKKSASPLNRLDKKNFDKLDDELKELRRLKEGVVGNVNEGMSAYGSTAENSASLDDQLFQMRQAKKADTQAKLDEYKKQFDENEEKKRKEDKDYEIKSVYNDPKYKELEAALEQGPDSKEYNDLLAKRTEVDTANYEMNQLKNTTNNGILNNIYKLMLDGLIVYPRKMSEDVMKRYSQRQQALTDIRTQSISSSQSERDREANAAEEHREYAQQRVKSDLDARTRDQDKELDGMLSNIPFLGRIYKKAKNTGNKITGGVSNFLASLLEKNLYGLGEDPKAVAKTKEVLEHVNEMVKQGASSNEIKGYIATVTKESRQQFSNKLTSVKNTATSTAKSAVNSAKTTASNIVNAGKEGGLVGAAKEAFNEAKNFGKKTLDKIKNTPQYNELKKAFDEEKVKLDDLITDKRKAYSFVDKMFKAGKITQEQAKSFYDKTRAGDISGAFTDLKNNISNSKVGQLAQKGNNLIVNSTVGQAVSNTMAKIKNSELGQVAQKQLSNIKDKASEIKSSLTNKLATLKIGDKTLAEKLAETNNSELIQQLKNTKDPVEKAKLILKYGGDEIAEYKNSLTDFITEQASSGGRKGSLFTGVSNLLFGKKKTEENKEDLSNDLTRRQGTKEDQKLDKEEEEKKENEKKHLNFLEKIATALPFLSKNGIKLDKETTDKLDESNQKAAETMGDAARDAAASGSGGILDKVSGLIDKTGLGDTGPGQAVKEALGKAQGGINFLKKIPGVNKLTSIASGGLKKVATGTLSAVGGVGAGIAKGFAKGGIKGAIGGAVKGTAGLAGKAIGGTVKGAASLTGKVVGGSVKGAGKFVGNAHKGFFNLLNKAIQGIIKKFPGGKTLIEKMLPNLMKGIAKQFPKLTAQISAASASMATVLAAVAAFAAGMAKGAATCKKDLHLGKDIKPTASMRLICSIASGFNALLFGIPDIIAKTIFKYESFAQWMYDKFGSAAEKEAINRYHKYCALKSKVYGISDFNKLIAYENHNVADKAGRAVLHVLTFGIAKSNDEKEATMLGFNSVEVFKYWKEKKYQPLEELRKQVAEAYGGEKVVDKMYKFTADEDKNGEISEDEQEKADEQQADIQNQADFRKDFLEKARKWVIDNKLAWLNDRCTPEKFKKFTNQDAKVVESKTQKAKKIGKGIKTAFSYTALGSVLTKEGRERWKRAGKKITGAVKFVGKKAVDLGKKAIDFGKKALGLAKDTFKTVTGAIGKGLKKLGAKITARAKALLPPGLKKMGDFVKNFLSNKTVKGIKGIAAIREVFNTIIKALTEKCNSDKDFKNKFAIQSTIFVMAMPITITKAVAGFVGGRWNPEKYLGISVPQKTSKIKLIGGIIGAIKAIVPMADQACMDVYGKTLKRIVFDIVMKDREQATNDTFLIEKAKILGLTVEAMQKYENKLDENSTGKKIKNFFSNIFGGGADNADAKLCGFSDVDVFKFWREEKYEPLRQLEEKIAHKYGDLDDMRSETPKDPEAQKKFRSDYLKAAKEYVKERGLEWLTYRTSKQEYDERKKSKTLYLKADSTVKKENDNQKQTLRQRFTNFFFSSNRDTRGNAKQMYQSGNTAANKANYVEIAANDTKAMEQSLQEEYKYDQKAMGVMSQASSSIKSFWKSISPNFYGDQAPMKDPGDRTAATVNGDLAFAGKGGPEGTTEGLITKYKDRIINVKEKVKDKVRKVKNTISEKLSDVYGMDEPKIDKAKVMNSITNDFAKNFGDQLNERLNILEEMHKENLRHNKVAENFFNALVALVQQVATNTADKGPSPSTMQLNNFINAIAK